MGGKDVIHHAGRSLILFLDVPGTQVWNWINGRAAKMRGGSWVDRRGRRKGSIFVGLGFENGTQGEGKDVSRACVIFVASDTGND